MLAPECSLPAVTASRVLAHARMRREAGQAGGEGRLRRAGLLLLDARRVSSPGLVRLFVLVVPYSPAFVRFFVLVVP